MKYDMTALAFLAVLLVISPVTPMLAQANQMPEAPLQDPVRAPQAAWLVGPASANEAQAQLEQRCMMVNEFDNGFLIGVHANKAGLIGISMDTKQQAFQDAQNVQAAIVLGGVSIVVPAQASDQSTLMLDVSAIPDMRSRLSNLGAFGLKVADKTLYLSTTGLDNGFARMGDCLGETQAQAMPVAKDVRGTAAPLMQEVLNEGMNEPLALAMSSIVPSGYRFDLKDGIDPMTPITWSAGESWRETLVTALSPLGYEVTVNDREIIISNATGRDVRLDKFADKEALSATQPIWTALQGARLHDVLDQWGRQAGINVEIDLDGEYMLPEDVAFDGTIQAAVQSLMAMLDDDSSLRAEFKSGQKVPDQKQQKQTSAPSTWRALEGASLQQVLQKWADQDGVELVWNAPQIFSLSQTIRLEGGFTDAVIAALSQFDSGAIRPLAQLNKDPETGQKILILSASGDKS